MSVQFNNNPQQVVLVEPYSEDDRQHLQSPGNRVPLDRMTSRLKNPYADVQEQLNDIQVNSREERAERIRIRRIFDKVRRGLSVNCGYFFMTHFFSTTPTTTDI